MTNIHRGETELDLCGERLILQMTFNALVELEEAAGMTGIEILEKMTQRSIGVKAMAAVIWAGYRGALPSQERLRSHTLEWVGERVMAHGIAKLLAPVFMFLSRAYATEDQIKEVDARLGKEEPREGSTPT